MEKKQESADVRLPIASHHPATENQSTFPISPIEPVPRAGRPLRSRLLMASKSKRLRANFPITKHERLHGSPMMLLAQTSPTSHQLKAIKKLPGITQRLFRMHLSVCNLTRLQVLNENWLTHILRSSCI